MKERRSKKLSRETTGTTAKYDHAAAADPLHLVNQRIQRLAVVKEQTQRVRGEAGCTGGLGIFDYHRAACRLDRFAERFIGGQDTQWPKLTLSIGKTQRLEQPRQPCGKCAGSQTLPEPPDAISTIAAQ